MNPPSLEAAGPLLSATVPGFTGTGSLNARRFSCLLLGSSLHVVGVQPATGPRITGAAAARGAGPFVV